MKTRRVTGTFRACRCCRQAPLGMVGLEEYPACVPGDGVDGVLAGGNAA